MRRNGPYVLLFLGSPAQMNMTNADVHNIIHALGAADEAAGDLHTEYGDLREALVEEFGDDLQ